MSLIEPTDELGLPWDRLADGRIHVLRRGRDFYRGADDVLEAARNAARRMNMAVSVTKEQRLGKTFVWVQYSDGSVEPFGSCPRCGSSELRYANRKHAICASCNATLVVIPNKRRRTAGEGGGDGDGWAAALLRPLGQRSGGAKRVASEPEGLSGAELHAIFDRAKLDTPREQSQRWGRQSYNDVAAIITAGAFASGGASLARAEADDPIGLCVLLELGAKRLDVRVGVVLSSDDGESTYRVVNVDPVRLGRPGRYTFKAVVPGRTIAPGTYTARVSSALVKEGEFSRITRRDAFSFVVEGEPRPGDGDLELAGLEWAVDPGDGPWATRSGRR